MRIINTKSVIGICLVGVLAGYGAAEWIVPRYFHPTQETTIKTQSLMEAIGTESPTYYRQTATGNYLASQFAQNNKDWDSASDFMARVLQKQGNDLELKKHAMVLAMAAGQVNQAIALAREVSSPDDLDNLLAMLFLAADDFKNENYLGVAESLAAVDPNNVAAFILPILKLWADTATGVFKPEELSQQSFYAYHVLKAGQYLNRKQDAMAYADEALVLDEVDAVHLEKLGDAYILLDEAEKAKEFYQLIISRNIISDDIEEKLAAIEQGQSLDSLIDIAAVKSPKDGAALVFLDMAEILLQQYSDDSATIFARLALYLNPDLQEGHMIIGNVLGRHKRYDEAIQEYSMISENKTFHAAAQREIANLYTDQGKEDQAIKILEAMYEKYNDIGALIQIGDTYRFLEDYKKAVMAYNRVAKLWDEVPDKYWHVLYARGMAHERLKNYKESEADLLKALEFRPNHPFLLNYLGYSWADQGINLGKALDMIEKAAKIKPDDGYIADSLGWVYYKMNDYDGAIVHLERAVELLPYDATINDHLGDAYWQVGRKVEARFQWRRAVNYSDNNQADLKEKIEQKLAHGLDVEPADAISEPIKSLSGIVDEVIEEKIKPQL